MTGAAIPVPWACRLYYVYWSGMKMTEWTPSLKPSEQHLFKDDHEVELAAR
jgi:hypothetical protein